MECRNCGNTSAYQMRTTYENGEIRDFCDQCGVGSLTTVPDIYFKEPYWDPNLGSQDDPGPKYISSRKEKAYWLKKSNLREAGDRVHGATSFDPKYSRTAHENFRRQQQCRTK